MQSLHEQVDISIYHIEKSFYESLDIVDLTKDYWTISYVIDGDLKTSIGKSETRVNSGDVMIHPPRTPFSEHAERGGIHIYMIFDVKISPGISYFSRFPMPHVVSLMDPAGFAERLEELLLLCNGQETAMHKLQVTSVALQVLAHIHRSWEAAGSPPRPEELTTDVDRFAHLIGYMEENLGQKIQREDLARQMHLHPSYFNRAFKSVYGMSALRMLREMRLKRAMKLLEDTDYTLETIAGLCGMGDAAYFSRIFRQFTDIAPGDYRKSVKSTKTGFVYPLPRNVPDH